MQKNIISTTLLFIWDNGDIVNQARWISTMCMYECIKLVSLLSHKVVIFSWFFFCNKPFHAQLCSFYDSQFNKFI